MDPCGLPEKWGRRMCNIILESFDEGDKLCVNYIFEIWQKYIKSKNLFKSYRNIVKITYKSYRSNIKRYEIIHPGECCFLLIEPKACGTQSYTISPNATELHIHSY